MIYALKDLVPIFERAKARAAERLALTLGEAAERLLSEGN